MSADACGDPRAADSSAALPGPAGTTSLEAELQGEPSLPKRYFKLLGPGLVTGASDDDPSGIGTYASAGAAHGYALLWTAPLTFPLMVAVQLICARIGLVSGQGLAGVLRRHYGRAVLYPAVLALLVANTLNAGADLGAVAAGLGLLVPGLPGPAVVVAAGLLLLVLQAWGSYRLIAGTFKWLTLALLAYIGASFFAALRWGEVLRGTLLPTFRWDPAFLAMLVAVLGTTISPYLFFWQASQEVEEERARGRRRLGRRRGASAAELRYAAWDVSLGMLFSNAVMYFIILASAATLHQEGQTDIRSAAEAAQALRPLAGEAAELLLALGLVGTGLLAVPVLTASGAYAVAEALGWENGLGEKPQNARRFYVVLTASTLVGVALSFLDINLVDALVWTAVLNGVLAPPLLVLVLLVANNPAVMGKRVNGRALNVLGWATAALMFAAAAGLFLTCGQA
jgi:NRAMP (natural resistance-associated macrophage protein)-like metal ion transporter